MAIVNDICIIYVSCDKYSDLWKGYFGLFRRYWPDCPFAIYVLANSPGPDVDGVVQLAIGEDVSWSDNLLAALPRVGHKYVLILPDDFFLIASVPSDWVVGKMLWAVDHKASCLRLSPDPPKPVVRFDSDVGVVPRGSLYRTSLRFSLWDKEVLRQLLKTGESAWDFELSGSIRSDAFDGFFAIYAEPFKFANCVIKGRWSRSALRAVRRRGVRLDVSKRPVMSAMEGLWELAARVRSHFLLLFPHRSRRAVRSAVFRLIGRAGKTTARRA